MDKQRLAEIGALQKKIDLKHAEMAHNDDLREWRENGREIMGGDNPLAQQVVKQSRPEPLLERKGPGKSNPGKKKAVGGF